MRDQVVVRTVMCGLAVATMMGSTYAQETVSRRYLLERVGDAAVVQLYADGFESLSLREKTVIWHLYRAALAGRDIYYDQRYEHNLAMREVLEEIITHAEDVEPSTLSAIQEYKALLDQHGAVQ